MSELLRWLGFMAGLAVGPGPVIGVMKTFIVPRRSWSLIPSLIGRNGFRLLHRVAVRMSSFGLADRFRGFVTTREPVPTVLDILGGATGMT